MAGQKSERPAGAGRDAKNQNTKRDNFTVLYLAAVENKRNPAAVRPLIDHCFRTIASAGPDIDDQLLAVLLLRMMGLEYAGVVNTGGAL